jgi:hypothetical protein
VNTPTVQAPNPHNLAVPHIELVKFDRDGRTLWRADLVSPTGKRIRCMNLNTNLGGYIERSDGLHEATLFAQVTGFTIVEVEEKPA